MEMRKTRSQILKIARSDQHGNADRDDDDSHLGDFIEDQTTVAGRCAQYNSLSGVTKDVLDSLTPREAKSCACASASRCRRPHVEEVASNSTSRASASQIEAKRCASCVTRAAPTS